VFQLTHYVLVTEALQLLDVEHPVRYGSAAAFRRRTWLNWEAVSKYVWRPGSTPTRWRSLCDLHPLIPHFQRRHCKESTDAYWAPATVVLTACWDGTPAAAAAAVVSFYTANCFTSQPYKNTSRRWSSFVTILPFCYGRLFYTLELRPLGNASMVVKTRTVISQTNQRRWTQIIVVGVCCTGATL